MSFDLSTLSPKQLEALISNAKQRKAALKKRKPIAAVREKLAKAAASEGYSLDELFAVAETAAAATTSKRATKRGRKPGRRAAAKPAAAEAPAKRGRKPGRPAGSGSRAGGKVAPKYRNPANPDEVWSGRGMTPRWLTAYIQEGKTKDDFLI